MNREATDSFVPPTESFLARLIATPDADLFRGKVTGSLNARRLIARAQFPAAINDAIWSAVRASGLRRMKKLQLTTELIDLAGRSLTVGSSPDDVVADITVRAGYLASIGRFVPIGRLDAIPGRTSMPAEILTALRAVTDKLRGNRENRGKAALAIYNRIAADLGVGTPVETLIDRFGNPEAIATLISRPQRRSAVIDAALPGSLLQAVSKVVKQTRLWPSEKDDVARELAAHFADGLAGGSSATDLLADFGPLDNAAKLIRRGKIRNRPLAWHAARRSLQGSLILIVVCAVLWGIFALRFHNASPTIKQDYVADDDARTQTIPAADRAWPLYREGLLENEFLDPDWWREKRDEKVSLMNAMDSVANGEIDKNHADWQRVVEYMDRHRKSIELFLEASKKPDLGFIYRDSDNDTWLVRELGKTSAELYGSVKPDYYLPQFSRLPFVSYQLQVECRIAVENGNAVRAFDCIVAQLGIVDQIWHASNYVWPDLFACRRVCLVSRQLGGFLSARPELFTDEQLVALAHHFARVCDGHPRLRENGQHRRIDDFLQFAYTDDGNGGGRFTPQGVATLADLAKRMQTRHDFQKPESWDGAFWQLENLGELVATFSANRREIGEKLHELVDEHQTDRERTYAERIANPRRSELDRIHDSPALRQQYLPAVIFASLLYPVLTETATTLDIADMAVTYRDAALAAIALELHHRRTNQWPAKLDELVPRLLPSLPIDQVDGKPLRYRIVDGQPQLYSIGANCIDDGGAPPTPTKPNPDETVPEIQAPDGDLILYPPAPVKTR